MLRNLSYQLFHKFHNPFKISTKHQFCNRKIVSPDHRQDMHECSYPPLDESDTPSIIFIKPYCYKYLVTKLDLHFISYLKPFNDKELKCEHCIISSCQVDALYLDATTGPTPPTR